MLRIKKLAGFPVNYCFQSSPFSKRYNWFSKHLRFKYRKPKVFIRRKN